MRTIDADALKFTKVAEVNGVLTHVLTAEDINNAQTVEYPFYKEAYQTGYEEGKNERPQGEWIEGSNGNIKCNKCGAEIRYSYIANNKPDFPKFCCDCGASMKGGADMRPKTCTNCETFGHDCGDCEVGDDD